MKLVTMNGKGLTVNGKVGGNQFLVESNENKQKLFSL